MGDKCDILSVETPKTIFAPLRTHQKSLFILFLLLSLFLQISFSSEEYFSGFLLLHFENNQTTEFFRVLSCEDEGTEVSEEGIRFSVTAILMERYIFTRKKFLL